ncbi:MAG: hypothetical protein IH969_00150 [Candidatus Krumholzibacteriota bacterium]|nr:hypothetical protein [Candidatus Krumholzibacteriota bacterium]
MPILHVLAAGLTGSVLMSLVMGLITRAHLANADMIRGLGSLVTKSLHNAFPVGLLLHLLSGTIFAFPYTYVLLSVGIDSAAAMIIIGAAIGLFHGAAMSFILLAVVAENHPLEEFREARVEVAAAHVVGHVAYGIGVGLTVTLLMPPV